MLLKEFNAPDHHVWESERATMALRAFRKSISQKGFQKSYSVDWETHAVFYLINERGDDEAYVQRHNKNIIGLYFRIPSDWNKAIGYIGSEKFESVFRHEFQHYLDELDYLYPFEDFPDLDSYINSDVEYSAWFKQLAEPLLVILRAAHNGDDLSHFPKIDPNFSDFMRNGQHFGMRDFFAPYEKFSPKYRRRYLRELAAVHKAVVAIEGMAEKYSPKFLTRILVWLHRITGIEI